jgi:hypothetical protein
MCRSKWFAFFDDSPPPLTDAGLREKANAKKRRELRNHSRLSKGRDDLFESSAHALDGSYEKAPDLCGGIDFGSPICASPASVTSLSSETCLELQEEEEEQAKNSLFLNKGFNSYFENTFGMRKKFVKRGKGWGQKDGALMIKDEPNPSPSAASSSNPKKRKRPVPQEQAVVVEQKSKGLKAAVSPGGTVTVLCTKEVEDDEAEFDYDSDGNLLDAEGML